MHHSSRASRSGGVSAMMSHSTARNVDAGHSRRLSRPVTPLSFSAGASLQKKISMGRGMLGSVVADDEDLTVLPED